MRTFVALVFICIGVWLFRTGWEARASFKGRTQSALADVVRRFDGETRVPEHSWYMIAGGVGVLAGVGVLYAGRGK